MKSVQGDFGHAQIKMVADVYSHIIDDDRRFNAARLEEAFYSGRKTSTETDIGSTDGDTDPTQNADKELLVKLLANPEMSALPKTLVKNL